MNFKIIPLVESHWPGVKEIYQQGIATKNATFETECPEWGIWDKKFLQICRFVAIDIHVLGWATLSATSARLVYKGVAEVTVYVHENARGQSIGKHLLEKLIHESERNGFWTLQAGIFPENLASLKIHKNLGFREVGFREKIAKMDGIWRNTLLLERRSKIVGID
jgi:L-amino acid N-acyltransferase YncA